MYDLEIDRVSEGIRSSGARRVLIQLADGMKHKAEAIVREIEEKSGASVFIWFGSCYGGCDIPLGLEGINIDMVVQWGHNAFVKEDW